MSQQVRSSVPRHLGVIVDGNRRWARENGRAMEEGYKRGSEKLSEVLGWCEAVGIEIITLWVLSVANLEGRSAKELRAASEVIEKSALALAAEDHWRVNVIGAMELLPEDLANTLKRVERSTSENPGMLVNFAVAYGGRREILDAIRLLLRETDAKPSDLAEKLTEEDFSKYLYTAGIPDPDLILRTSGEQRLSGFMPWQSVHAEAYFCDAHWPALTRGDFEQALNAYATRVRTFGT
ncbi:polyprenyl diphosphate synthase [Streptomyces phyllanthi]|uniref:polyprenyl diphosphate synthase n=1 Tax=Streptomyces phyllanthi TaxID=1803180 RepID=UPI001D14AE14|nr:polyprenyl diphosphate synthase [Streptomyces phyllanthi]